MKNGFIHSLSRFKKFFVSMDDDIEKFRIVNSYMYKEN